MYKVNPKTENSGIICCIPQSNKCSVGCKDCFFQSGRSYLEPLEDNLPNMPEIEMAEGRVVRVNDGNDSNLNRDVVISSTDMYKDRFFNTSINANLDKFPAPVVLTINPSTFTDTHFNKVVQPIPTNLMYVRFRANTWNMDLLDQAVLYYTINNLVPVVITFMAYHNIEDIPEEHRKYYDIKKRTINEYYCINKLGWNMVCSEYEENNLVYTCGKNYRTHSCQRCGNCIREYYNTKERMKL